jgi:hypothetical protein
MPDIKLNINDILVIIACIILFVFAINYIMYDPMIESENFGALQSLYSNDGIQDAYLTIENDPDDPSNYDPYAYWRGVTWDLPTRNLNKMYYYPTQYDNFVDRYSTSYPYW